MSEHSRYQLSRAVMDFTAQGLAEGLELYLSEGIHNCGDLIKNEGGSGKKEKGLPLLYRSGEFLFQDRSFQPIRTEVVFDTERGILRKTSCTCSAFGKDYYSCRHIHALTASLILEEEGEEVFEGSEVEGLLRERTGVEDPFIPGILRKTDRKLLGLIGAGNDNRKADAVWLPEDKSKKTKAAAELKAEMTFLDMAGNKGNFAELHVGPKRLYVIRRLPDLLEAYENNRSYSFTGSVCLPAGRASFDKKSRELMDYLLALYRSHQREERTNYLFPYDHRTLDLSGQEMDGLMGLLDGETVSYNLAGEKLSARVSLSGKPDAIRLQKKTYGAELTLKRQAVVGCGFAWMYLWEDGVILRLPVEHWEKRKQLAEAASGGQKLYIQDRDLPAICGHLAELACEENGLVTEGFELAPFLPEKPVIQIRLDYPQEGLISASCKAIYRDREYLLFDRKKGKKIRNFREEGPAAQAIWQYFSAFDDKTGSLFLECNEEELYTFLTETIPALAEYGEILVSDRMKKLKVRPVGTVSIGVQVDAGRLVMSLHSEEMGMMELAQVLSSYNRKKKYTRLKNGEFIKLDPDAASVWETMSETYRNYGKKNPEAMKLPLFRALYIEEMLRDKESVSFEAENTYETLIRKLKKDAEGTAEVPEALSDVLRPYQAAGFRWIAMLKENGFGGILADDMGLGKTIQVLALLLSEQCRGLPLEKRRTLITAPASLVYNWKHEVESFTPSLKTMVIAGTAEERKDLILGIPQSETEVYITSYDLLKRDISWYEEITFANHVIDEAQFIKNQNTQASKGVRLINSTFRLALTGTPIENRLSELWSIFDFLMPGFLYAYTRFRSEFETPVVSEGDKEVMDRLRHMVHPFILRRLKKEVLKDLPDKLEETVTVQLEGEQRKLYDAYAERLRLSLENKNDEEFGKSKIEILAELTRLRQLCCGPELFLEDYKGENAKKEACLQLIERAIDGGHKVLLFSQFTSALDELCAAMKEREIAWHRIDGSTDKKKRMQQVEAFQSDRVPVFAISLKAGGTGLNLTAADIVIHYDPWWNLAAQNQATDRAHRIGQENMVTVYQLIAENTIEEQVMTLQKTKAKLAGDILSGEGIKSVMIHREDLLALL